MKAYFAGGCFWCLEAIFQRAKGVSRVTSGYSGGETDNPSYHQIDGHAETVEIEFDSKEISFEQLLDIFFAIHNPTTLNQQGADIGRQYRSAIFYLPKQKTEVEKALKRAQGLWDDEIVTQIEPFDKFYPAEDYHQNYFTNNPEQMYCQVVINPKIEKFEKKFKKLLREV